MQDDPAKNAPSAAELDPETLEFVQAVFGLVRSGDAGRLGPLLERGLPPNLRNQKGDSLLMLAAYHGHRDAARHLLEHGADPELRNDQGQTPLLGAAFKGDVAMVDLLLAHGARRQDGADDGRHVQPDRDRRAAAGTRGRPPRPHRCRGVRAGRRPADGGGGYAGSTGGAAAGGDLGGRARPRSA
jgi:ankyrin repeat protein